MRDKKTNWKKVGVIALLVVAGVGAIALSAKASNSEEILITDHDSVWDYRFYNGRWYTRKKAETVWIDMLTALSPDNYSLAISRLTNHLNKK